MLVLLASAALLPLNFAPVRSTASLASSALLPLNTAPVRSTTSCGPLVLGRRGLISNAAAVFSAIVPSPAFAVKTAPVVDLTAELLFILRVQEACSQETRLIKTGKYRELQRLDIKRAVGMMLENYDLRSRFNRASSAAPREQVTTALEYGNTAVEGLIQILEYFPSSLKADDLTKEQSSFVLRALASTSSSIDRYMSLMPADQVDTAKKQLLEENRLNDKEFPPEMELLNPGIGVVNYD